MTQSGKHSFSFTNLMVLSGYHLHNHGLVGRQTTVQESVVCLLCQGSAAASLLIGYCLLFWPTATLDLELTATAGAAHDQQRIVPSEQ